MTTDYRQDSGLIAELCEYDEPVDRVQFDFSNLAITVSRRQFVQLLGAGSSSPLRLTPRTSRHRIRIEGAAAVAAEVAQRRSPRDCTSRKTVRSRSWPGKWNAARVRGPN